MGLCSPATARPKTGRTGSALFDLHITQKNSAPNHPQTCGKGGPTAGR